jgi:hypothetical protein
VIAKDKHTARSALASPVLTYGGRREARPLFGLLAPPERREGARGEMRDANRLADELGATPEDTP